MDRSVHTAHYSQSLTSTAESLRKKLGLFLVHIIPAELIDSEAWEEDGDRFSLELGNASAGFFEKELSIAMRLKDYKHDRLQIGVAGGRSVFGLFNALPSFAKRDGFQVQLVPLVIGPVPLSIYSASSVAQLAVQKFSCAHVRHSADIGLREKVDNDGVRHKYFELRPFPLTQHEIAELDWLLLGIGSTNSESLKSHLNGIDDYKESTKPVLGDICSRLFDARGCEIGREVSDIFVGLGLTDLENLALPGSQNITRVVAVAGGKNKVDAMTAILRRQPRLINILVTDELTARAIIRKLRTPETAVSQSPGNDQIPVEVLQKHHGKWIIWDEDARCVLGTGDTLDEAEEQAKGKDSGHLVRFHHALWTEVQPAHSEA